MDGSKIVTLLCVMAYVNSMLCENNKLIYTKLCISMGRAWRKITCINYNYPWGINVHVVVHHTYNMRICSGISIAYAQGHRIMLGVCAWVWSSIISADEWVVS